MNVEMPADLNTVETDDELASLKDALTAEFDQLHDEGSRDLATLTELADAIDKVETEIKARQTQAAADEAAIADLAKRVHPEASNDPTSDDDDETLEETPPPPPAETAPPEETPAPDEAKELVTASAAPARRPSLQAAARRAPRPAVTPPNSQGMKVTITAAADVPGLSAAQKMDVLRMATAFHDKARNLNDHSGRVPIGKIEYDYPEELTLGTNPAENARKLDALIGQPTAQALTAAGGWCAPSTPVFSLFDIGPDLAGLFDLPTLGGSVRAGVMLPTFYGIGDVSAGLWTWTEANDIAANASTTVTNKVLTSNVATITTSAAHGYSVGNTVTVAIGDPVFDGTYVITAVTSTTFSYAKVNANVTTAAATGTAKISKGCLRIPCPTWSECRLEAEGLCVSHGNLSDRAWPELTRYFINIVMGAHAHRISAAKIAKVTSGATAVTPGATMLDSDAAGDVLGFVELQAMDIRSAYRMAPSRAVEVLAPEWLPAVLRANLAKRQGVDMLSVTDAQVNGWLTARGVRVQYLSDYQPLYNGTAPATTFPANVELTWYLAGAYVGLDGGSIDLGVMRDSFQVPVNDFTAAWSEQFYQVCRPGPLARKATIPLTFNGVTGGP